MTGGVSDSSSGAAQNFDTGVNSENAQGMIRKFGNSADATTLQQQIARLTSGQEFEESSSTDVKLKDNLGTLEFQDQIVSARDGQEPGTEASTSGGINAQPGTPEYEQQVANAGKQLLKEDFLLAMNSPATLILVRDSLSPEIKQQIDGRLTEGGVQPSQQATTELVEVLGIKAQDIQNKIGPDGLRELINNPSPENLAKYPQLSEEQKALVQDPIMQAVVNSFDASIDKVMDQTVGPIHDHVERMLRADPTHPELVAPRSSVTATSGGGPPDAPGGNPFFAVSLTAVLAIFFYEQMQIMSQVQQVEAKNKIAAMDRTMEIAKSAADQIIASAEKQAMMYFVQAAMAAVNFVSTGITLGYMANSRRDAEGQVTKEIDMQQERVTTLETKRNQTYDVPGEKDANGMPLKETQEQRLSRLKTERSNYERNTSSDAPPDRQANLDKKDAEIRDLEKTVVKDDQELNLAKIELNKAQSNKPSAVEHRAQELFWQRVYVGQMVDSGTKMVENAANAMITLLKAENDARLKMLEGYEKINETAMQSATKGFNDATEAIRSIIESKERALGALYKAFSIGVRN